MREKFFFWLARITYQRHVPVFLICFALTVVFAGFASFLRMDMTWQAMIPDGHPAKTTFQTVIDEFGTATQIIIALEGPSRERLIQAADELAQQLQNLTIEVPAAGSDGKTETQPVVKRVQIKYNTGFLARHGLMLAKAKELRNQSILYTDYNLVPFLTHVNDVLESEYVQDSGNLTKQEKEAERSLDGMYEFAESLGGCAAAPEINPEDIDHAVDAMTTGDGYYLSTDKKMLLIFLTPAVSLNDPFDITALAVNAIEARLHLALQDFPDITAGMTGGHVITRDEMEAGITDTMRNVSFAFVIILIIFIISFRMVSGPLLAMIVLTAGITWDMGLASLVFGRLNLFTAMCGVILIGLGVDYAIHILSAYSEFRHKGYDVEASLREAFSRIGAGLITGALTTAAAFLSLLFTSYPVFREFGFVVGTGIISCLLASLFFLPASLVLKERLWRRFRGAREFKRVDMEFGFLGKLTALTTRRPWITVTAAGVLTIIFVMFIPDVYMNRNYMDMEPAGLESVRLQREIPKRFNISPDNMVAVMDNLEQTGSITDLLNERPAVGLVESLADYLPSPQKQAQRMPLVKAIAETQNALPAFRPVDTEKLIEQLYRFGDNLTEMSSMAFIGGLDKVFDKTNYFLGLDEEGDQTGVNRIEEIVTAIENSPDAARRLNEYQRIFMDAMKKRISGMANAETITLESIPDDIRERFISKDGKHFLITIYSKRDIWDGLLTSPFVDTVIQDVPAASGMPLMMKVMVQTAKEQGAMAFLLAFIAFFIILMVDFRSLKTTIIAALPLLMSILWMLGIMGLSGFPFSVVNVIGLPLILGIGIDDGVHIIHRYRVEGRIKLPYAIASIGKAIFLTTLTTLLGFGSLIPSSYRGYASLGTLVALGISLCFFTSVVVLPAVLKIAWGGKREHPRFFNRSR